MDFEGISNAILFMWKRGWNEIRRILLSFFFNSNSIKIIGRIEIQNFRWIRKIKIIIKCIHLFFFFLDRKHFIIVVLLLLTLIQNWIRLPYSRYNFNRLMSVIFNTCPYRTNFKSRIELLRRIRTFDVLILYKKKYRERKKEISNIYRFVESQEFG